MKFNNLVSFQKKEQPSPLKILGVRQEGDRVYLKVSLTRQYYEQLYQFLKEKGLIGLTGGRDAIALLAEYGLTELTPEDLAKQWDIYKMSRYAAACFKCYELFEKNCAIAAGLRFHLLENKTLKKKLKVLGLNEEIPHDVWDDWGQEKIQEFYNRYVFCR